uniref:Growth regulating estrogen receptor binding 1 n=1 Tax=Oncorhynchus kisutch TaxID=8019 RepID=A0A8C7FQX2_ONCKI
MGNSYAGQLRTTRFEEVLHNSIEASLRSNTVVPRPVFSQLYLEAKQPTLHNGRVENEDEEEEDGSESNSPPVPYKMKPTPEGCCTTDGFCQAGRDLRLSSLVSEPQDVPPGFQLVGALSAGAPDTLLVCAVDRRFLPDERGCNALLGFSGNCIGCGEKGFRYFTEFSNHINLKLSTQPKKQKHLKYHLYRNNQGQLVRGAAICWKGLGKTAGGSSALTADSPLIPPSLQLSSYPSIPPPPLLSPLIPPPLLLFPSSLHPFHLSSYPPSSLHPFHLSSYHPSSLHPFHLSSYPPHPSIPSTSPPIPPHPSIPSTSPPIPPHPSIPSTSPITPNPSIPPPLLLSPLIPPSLHLSSYHPSSLHPSTSPPITPHPSTSPPITLHPSNSPPIPPPLLLSPLIPPPLLLSPSSLHPFHLSSYPPSFLHPCHGSLPRLSGKVSDVQVSSLLQSCYQNCQALPRVYQHYGSSPIQPLSVEMQILLTVYYLVQLGPDQVLLIEDLEQIFMRSWRESHLSEIRQYQQPQPGLSLPQLPWLANLAASSCGEGVVVLGEKVSMALGLSDTFSRLMEGQLAHTNYVVIICTAKGQETESCMVVTGQHQCRALTEGMFSPSDSLREISQQLSSGMTQELTTFCNSLGPDALCVYIVSNKCVSTCVCVCVEYRVEWREVRPIQLVVARKLLSHVCAIADSSTQNLDLGSFDRVHFLICVPPSEVTFQQTVLHLWNSGVLQNLGLEQDCLSQREAERYVVKMDQEARARIDDLIQEANRNPNTLFILVHDHAHWDISRCVCFWYGASGGDSGSGLVDSLLNSCQIKDANNILILHVTSFPFALQTQHTRISPYNEIHWPSAFNNEVDLYLEKTQYFGVCELLDSTRSGSGLPLLRYDSSFESMASVLEERFPKLHSAVIRTQVLIQHYCVAMMAVSGRSGSGGRSQHKHTSVETLEIVQSLLSASQRCPSHHGHMVLLRLPSLALAGWAHQRLVRIRQRLGLGELFEIILGNPSQTLSIGQSFTERIKTWLKIQETDWVPRTYLELEALPCILILSGADPLGESLPRSLKYCDLRVISSSYLQRTALEQELGLAAYLVRVESQGSQPHGHAPGLGSDLSESDSDKLNSTDNEEKEGGENSERSLKSDLPGLGHSAPSVPHPPSVLQPPRTFHDSIAADPLHPHTTPQGPHRPPNTQRRPSMSTSLVSSSPLPPSLLQGCSWARGVSRPPSLLLPRGLYDIIKARDGSGLPRCTSFLPHRSVAWASSFRPLLSKMMTCTEQSLYYRQWTIPQPRHMDSSNRPAEGRTDNFHPRRLLLSGPPQVGKTGAYLQFLGILSRMLIRLMEVDIYDEEDINFSGQLKRVQYQPTCASWPVTDTLMGIPFDYTVHDPKYEDISTVYCPDYYPNTDGIPRRQEDVYLRRHTARIKLSKYAAYNTYHHCEQCHQYTGFNPAYQMYELTLHAFTFSHLLLGEDIQLYFIIPKSKHHHFSFSQPGGQLESMRLPLTSDWNPDCIKSPIFTPTTGRHEHGLFNLYHAMDGAAHLHILVIKEYEMAVYKKYWPNHIMLVLPTIFNGLERSRRVEGGGPPADVWPFIILSDDSCVMWNAVDLDSHSTSGPAERNVSLKQMLQHMEACPDLTQFGLCGIRKWSSHFPGQGSGGGARHREPFSRGHLHDFLLLNVDLTQGIQFNQNRFTCDDVDFTLRVHSAGLLICRFNNFSVMKKQISIGGYHTFIIKNKMTDVPTSVQPSQYICAPDSKHPFLATPAQLLLEKYLQHSSLFPLSTCNYTHPILSVDYQSLGSRPRSINICTTGLLFSGLLLCFWDSFVTPGFLKNFHFLKGAVLCVICADRSSLRQTVVRLELEDEWRFRLSDEFQTANAKEDRPLFFLTGKHI